MRKSSIYLMLIFVFSTMALVTFQNFTGVFYAPAANEYKFTSLESNSVLWPVAQASDGVMNSVYSSNYFANPKDPDLYLIGRLGKNMPISRIVLGARMNLGKAIVFPKLYDIYLLDSLDLTKWIHIGSFGNQPDELGVVSLDLGNVYISQGVKLVPRMLGQDPYNNSYLQIAEFRVFGPTIFRFTSAVGSNSVLGQGALDGDNSTFTEYYVGTAPINGTALSIRLPLATEQMVSKIYLRASFVNGAIVGFPKKYKIEYTNARLLNTYHSLGEFTRQPDKNGNLILNLKGMKSVSILRLTPIEYGPGLTAGTFSLRFAEMNVFGPMIYKMSSAFSNDVHLPATGAIDSAKTTWYSSKTFPQSTNVSESTKNNRGTMLAAWTASLEPISKIVLHARMQGTTPLGFPKSYLVHVADPTNTKWLLAGVFNQQPNSDGFAIISLNRTYLTYGISITPIELGVDESNTPTFQLAEMNAVGTTLGKGRLGIIALFDHFSLNAGESLRNGSLEFKLQTDGNLVVVSNSENNRVVWATGTGGRSCTIGCTVEFKNGFLSLLQNGTIYWSTQNFGAGKTLHLTRGFPFVSISNSGEGVWPSIRNGEVLRLSPTEQFRMTSDGNLIQEILDSNSQPIMIWQSQSGGKDCLGQCRSVFQPDSTVNLFKSGTLFWTGRGFIY